MASDIQKVVEVALKLTGVDPAKITPLVTGFQNLDNKIKETQASINTFQGSLNQLKVPASFATLANNLSTLGSVKLKDLAPLATNLEKISKIQAMPKIGTFVNNIEKLSGTSLAGLTTLARNLEAIAKINVEATVSKLRDLNTALRALEKQGGLSTFARFATDVRAMRTSLDSSQASINQITDSINRMGNTAQSNGLKLRTFGEKVRTVMTFRLISEGLIQLKLAVTNSISAIINYSQALKDLQAITGATNIEVAQMGRKIIEVASTTKFSAEEVAAGMRTLGQAGFTASEAVQTMQAVSDLATGTLSDMAQTVDLMTTAMRVFQIEASQSAMVSDVFANAVNRSKLTIEKLRTAMNYVGPIAKDANVTFQEVSAAMMTLANSGLRASTIGTSLRQVFSALVSPSKKLKDAALAAGVSLEELNPATNSLSDVLANLNLVLKDTGTAFDIFGKRGASAALALTKSGSQYNDLLNTVSRTGTAAEQAAKQMEGLGVSFKNLRDKLGNLAITLGDSGIVTVMKTFVDVARELVDVLDELARTTTGRVVVSLGVFASAILFLAGIFIYLKTAIVGSAIFAWVAGIGAGVVSVLKLAAALGVLKYWFLIVAGVMTAVRFVAKGLYSLLIDESKEAAEAAIVLADEYENLAKKVRDYKVETVNLKEDSVELRNASLRLRAELVEVARGVGEVAEKARIAYDRINPLTGEFKDSGEALQEYQETVDKFKLDSLLEALEKVSDSLERQGNKWVAWKNVALEAMSYVSRGAWELGTKLGIHLLSFEWKKGADLFVKTAKDSAAKIEDIANDLDVSKRIREGTISWKELQEIVANFDLTNMTRAQREQKDAFDLASEAARKYINELQDTGQINLNDTVEWVTTLAEKANESQLFVSALISRFEDLQASKAPSNIVEKWEKDSSKLTDYLTEYIGALNAANIEHDHMIANQIKQHEAAQESRIREMNTAKEALRVAKETGADMVEAHRIFRAEEQRILDQADKDREAVATHKQIQQLKLYAHEQRELEKHLRVINEKYAKNPDKRIEEEERARAESAKRSRDIITSPLEDPAEQNKQYTRHLKERESAHAAHINAIKRLEADKQITVEESSRRQQEAELAFYAISLQNAKNHLASMKEKDDPDEYNRRYNAVLEAEKKFYDEKAKNALASSSLLADLEKKEAEGRIKISEKIFKQILSNQKEATKTAEKELRADYEENILYLETYYRERRNLAEVNYREERDLLVKRGEDRQKELDMLISLSNSEIEIKDLKNKKVEEESDLLTVLNALYYQKRQLLADLNRQEVKDIETSRKRIDKTMESIAKNREQAEIDSKKLGLAETFNLGLIQIERRHQEEREEILRHARSVDEAELLMKEARAQQEIEIDARVATHEREMFFLRLQMHEDFASNTSSIMQSIIASGLVQSKKMFKIGQAFAIAEATISAYNSAQKAKENIMNTYKNVPGAVVLANIAFAAEVAKGLANVAKIAAQQPPGYKEGGLIGGSSPHKKADNVNIRATAGEYMQPVDAVRYYGLRTMNAIRKLQIPREALSNFLVGSTAGLGRPTPSFALASGGSVPASSSNNDFTGLLNEIQNMGSNKQPINIINVTDPREISNYLASPEGTNALMNVISSRGEHLKRLLR